MNEVRGRRWRQAERRRAALLDTALDVFAAKGVDGATVKDLSEAAGVAQGLLYHYFRSKEELLQAVLERHYFLPELARLTAPDRDRPAAVVLREVVSGFAAVLREHRQVVRVMLREAPSNPAVADRIARAQHEASRLLAAYLNSRVAAGELRPHDTESVARLLLFSVVTAHMTDTPPDDFLSTVVDTVLHGVAAQEGRSPSPGVL